MVNLLAVVRKYLLLCMVLALSAALLSGRVKENGGAGWVNAIDRINFHPQFITVKNTKKTYNRGGHLQGIQCLRYGRNDYYVLTGSSDSWSYYAVVKAGKDNSVISVNKILPKPFKHAGGFQIYKDLMAVGVEDNSARDRSKVFIYRLKNPEDPPEKPLAVIERSGAYERATAGCTGIVETGGKILVAVGDWDSRHLDFYTVDENKMGMESPGFQLVSSFDARQTDKKGWIDDEWLPYQNINLLKDGSGRVYLAGMTSKGEDSNVIDLYRIETENLVDFKLTKIYTKKLVANAQARFGWAAGICPAGRDHLKILSCGPHIRKHFSVSVYE